MLERLSRRKRNIALGILGVFLAWFCWSIRSVLNPLLVGYLLAYILHPLVLRIERLGFTRRTAVNLTFGAGFLAAIGLSLALVLQISSLRSEVRDDVDPLDTRVQAPKEPFQVRMQNGVNEFTARLNGWGLDVGEVRVPDMTQAIQGASDFLAQNTEESLEVAGRGVSYLRRLFILLFKIGGLFVLVPLYTYYFLFVLRPIHDTVRRYLPKRDRTRISRVGGKIGAVISNFFRGRLTVCFFKGLFLSVALTLAGVQYAFLFGMLSGFLSILPFFGPFIGFALAFTVGIAHQGVVGSLVRTGVIFALAEVLEGYVLLPRILGDTLGLHPLVVFFSLLAGGAALGMLGVLVALPLTASVVILCEEFVLPALKDWADEDPDSKPG